VTVWHWVRHGPTHARSFVGWRDLPADLSDLAQIKRLRASLPEEALLVSSDLARASGTAEAIRGPGHTRLPHEPGLREIHFGIWDGMKFDDISTRDPDLSRAFWETPGTVRAPAGESWDAASARVAAAVHRISARHPERHIIAVAHFGVILTQLQRALATTAQDVLAHSIDNLSVTTLDWRGQQPKVDRLNHLP